MTNRPARPLRILDLGLFLVGVAGMATAITLMFLGMRAVMEIGGSCAEGGPYVSARACPDGATPALLLGIVGGIAATGLAAWKGAALGGAFASVWILGWPALFGSLGWNFLEFGLGLHAYPDGSNPGGDLSLVICGVVFEAMAIPVAAAFVAGVASSLRGDVSGPLASSRPTGLPGVALHPDAAPARPAGPRPVAGDAAPTLADEYAELDRALRAGLASRLVGSTLAGQAGAGESAPAATPPAGGTPGGASVGDARLPVAPGLHGAGEPIQDDPEGLVEGLERLAALHRAGALSDFEFTRAKARLLAGTE